MLKLAVALNDPNKSIVSRIVHACTKSASYHCELVFSDGMAAIVDPSNIVLSSRTYTYYNWTLVPIPGIDEQQEVAIRQAYLDILKQDPKYDWLGAIAGFFGSKKEDPKKWFCSELVAYLLAPYVPECDVDKWMTPDRLWKILSDRIDRFYPEYKR